MGFAATGWPVRSRSSTRAGAVVCAAETEQPLSKRAQKRQQQAGAGKKGAEERITPKSEDYSRWSSPSVMVGGSLCWGAGWT